MNWPGFEKLRTLLIFSWIVTFAVSFSFGSMVLPQQIVSAAVANDGTDDEVRPPVENPPPPTQPPKPPVTVKPPVAPAPPPASGPALSITDVRVRNEDKEGNGLSDYKSALTMKKPVGFLIMCGWSIIPMSGCAANWGFAISSPMES